MKTIILHGILAKKFGKSFNLAVSSTKEAMRALCVQLIGFEAFMMNAHRQGLRFAVFHDKQNVGESELEMTHTAKVIRVVPVVEGSKKAGLLETVLGAVMVVAGIVATGMGFAPVGAALIGAGIGMMVGGISQMLMPKVDTQDNNQDGNKANKGFGGAVTTVAQGNPVPILYGEREIGGFILSASQLPEDMM
ncbi:tail assembly protein [Moraxella bovis]|uniref:tail assembly protein n=1 Tax=Moraxella bovis TaxID=476 RepID=UPI00227AAF1C|nr:tail assembly protein [Moraxella bovis]WAJ74894.1 tail assembly protein [Moraxella bovis]WAJ74901.1 tail assembly protein [Moraxella bovis]